MVGGDFDSFKAHLAIEGEDDDCEIEGQGVVIEVYSPAVIAAGEPSKRVLQEPVLTQSSSSSSSSMFSTPVSSLVNSESSYNPCAVLAKMGAFPVKGRILNQEKIDNMGKGVVINRKLTPHPVTGTNLPTLVKIQSSKPEMNREGMFFDRCFNNMMFFQFNSITEGSRTTYLSGWNHWVDHFVPEFGTDRFLRLPPRKWLEAQPQPFSFVECVMGCFMAYLESLGLQPTTIFTYTCGVRFFLRSSGVDTLSLDDSRFFKSIKSGISHEYRLKDTDDHCKANHKALPVNVVMLNDLRAGVRSEPYASCYEVCLCCAIHAAFVYLFRCCEFLYVTDSGKLYHYLREQDVRFSVKSELGLETLIPSSEAYLYADRYRMNKQSVLVDVCTNVRHAKNDPEGEGNKFVHEIESPGESRAFCIASMMFEHAIKSRPKRDWPFFSCPAERWVLSTSQVTNAIKKVASRYFSPDLVKKYTSRSCRVGGASALMNAGSPDSYIKKAGRWKSDAFLIYLRVSASLCHTQTTAMCQTSSFSIESIKKLMTAATDNHFRK